MIPHWYDVEQMSYSSKVSQKYKDNTPISKKCMKFSEETHDGNDEEESDSDSSYTEIPQMQMMT